MGRKSLRNFTAAVSAGLLACIGASTAPALAQDDRESWASNPLVLEPVNDWSLREYDDKCRMRRTFGKGDDRSTLWLDRGGDEPSFNITAIGRPFRHPYGPNISVQFAPEAGYFRNYLSAKSSRGRPTIVMFGARLAPTPAEIVEMERYESGYADLRRRSRGDETVDVRDLTMPSGADASTAPERTGEITELRIGRALADPVVLVTGPLTEPMAELEACAFRMLAKMAGNGMGGTPPEPKDMDKWVPILQRSYPSHLLRAGQEASMLIAVNVGTSGKPTYCEVKQVVGLTSFNDTVCLTMLRHAVFEPARNAEGEAIVGRYSTRVTFALSR